MRSIHRVGLVTLAALLAACGSDGTGPGGTYSLSVGNPNSALAQLIDGGVGQFSTGYLGGTGMITLTEATLSRVRGTLSFIAYTAAGTGAGNPVVTVQNGSFEVRVVP